MPSANPERITAIIIDATSIVFSESSGTGACIDIIPAKYGPIRNRDIKKVRPTIFTSGSSFAKLKCSVIPMNATTNKTIIIIAFSHSLVADFATASQYGFG